MSEERETLWRRELRVHVDRNHAANGFDLYIVIPHQQDGGMDVVTNMVLTQVEAGAVLPGPAVRLTRAAGQQLIDELYRAGLRPADAAAADATLAAHQQHIDDLRHVAFTTLDRLVAVAQGGAGGEASAC